MSDKTSSASLYVHVPFCRARCAYCDFNTYAGLDDLVDPYVTAICREIEHLSARWPILTASTVYVGGGTPSRLAPGQLARILSALRSNFRIVDQAEITLEANPGTVPFGYLEAIRPLGISRLSLGLQSTHASELRTLGRIHSWDEGVQALTWARQAGFDNVNLDLIFGLPRQMLSRWTETLDAALALAPEHLSLYGLIVDPETRLGRAIEQDTLPAPDDDLAATMYEAAETRLAKAGFFHYEISNWARATSAETTTAFPTWWPAGGKTSESVSATVSRHNLTYWRNQPWLGLGAGAHSWMGERRRANLAHPCDYIAALEAGQPPLAWEERIDRRTEMGETMMMGLRLAEGVTDARFRARFGVALEAAFGTALTDLAGRGLLSWDGTAARLTARGRLLGNRVFERFV